MKTKKVCAGCGTDIQFRSIQGYRRAAECGRPPGAKGEDTGAEIPYCPNGCPNGTKIIQVEEPEWFDKIVDWSFVPEGYEAVIYPDRVEIVEDDNYMLTLQEEDASYEGIRARLADWCDE